MSDIGPIQSTAALSAQRTSAPVSVSPIPTAGQTRASDQVDLSDRARLLSQLSALPDVRQDMVNLARSRVESGFYDNESVIDTTIDKLSHELGQ